MAGENLLQTIQKFATVIERVDMLAKEQEILRSTATARLDRMEAQLTDLRERVARLEASRPADAAELKAEIAKFQANLERTLLQQERAQNASPKRLPRNQPDGESE